MIKKLIPALAVGACMAFSIQKEKKFIPPGTVQISESFYADAAEVSNLAWQEYESWTKAKYGAGSKEHLALLPDTTVWENKDAYNGAYVKYYYRHAAYKDYPVVGVSYQQVLGFCKWRTDRVKEFFLVKNKKSCNITYRLPGKEEWELLSSNGPALYNNGKNDKGEFQLNCYRPEDTLSVAGASDVTAPVYSYLKNRFGLFNTLGNVSEMVSEQGISKGGSWRHSVENCRPGKDLVYTKPEAWLGFRCVCVVNDEPLSH